MSKPSKPGDFSLWSIALPAFGPSLLFGIGEGAILPIIPLSARTMGSSLAGAALIVALIGIGSLVSNIPASMITAKFGERLGMVGAAILSLCALLLCVFATELWAFAAGILLIGAASAVFNLARQSYLTEAVPPLLRARAMSTLGGVGRIGLFAGPFIGALVIHLVGLSGAYWVAAVAVAGAGALALWLPDLVSDQGERSDGPAPTLRFLVSAHKEIFLSVGLGILFVSAVRSSRQVVVPLWADNLGLSPAATSLIYGMSGAIDMLVFYPAGKVMDKKGRIAVAVPSMVLMGVSLLLMPLTSGALTLLLVAMLIGFGNGIGSGLVMTLGADYAPRNGRAQFLGVWRFISDIGGSSGPAILAGLTAVVSLSFGIAATGLLGLVAAAVLGYSVPRHKPIQR
ncbi:MFS transporter [Arthrobacter antibioticus]|uniref:MFS transporter n=1 Tax=Arthrobacter sp. H35-MC1 TaxID=3046203 RepID=UPI0024BAF145|nr:MFS transporter [Arthrobacter sp. H35-MC1]MDJ0316903.1 MFS transporter [Arthrobacter sp. H35-MC1]